MNRTFLRKEEKFLSHTFNKFRGVDNIGPTSRSGQPTESTYLITGENINIDKTGFVSRRDGYVLSKAGTYQHVWSGDGQKAYGLYGNNLVMLDKYLTITTLITGIGMSEMVFAQLADVVYFTNGNTIGSIENGVVSYPVDPGMINKAVIPPGNMLAFFNGRLLVVDGSILYVSDGGGAFDRYDLETGVWPFPETMAMIAPVEDGIFISSDKLYFLNGASPEDWEVVAKANYKAIKGTSYNAQNIIVGVADGGTEVLSVAVVFMTEEGICIGSNGGKFYNLTELHYDMPVVIKGTSIIRKFKGAHQYMAVVTA